MSNQKQKQASGGGLLSWLLIAAGLIGIIITGIIASAFLVEQIEYMRSKDTFTTEARLIDVQKNILKKDPYAVTEYRQTTAYADRDREMYEVTWEYEVHGEPQTYSERLSERPESDVTTIEVYLDSQGHYVRRAGSQTWTGIGIAIGVAGLLVGGFFIYLGADDLIKTLKKKNKQKKVSKA